MFYHKHHKRANKNSTPFLTKGKPLSCPKGIKKGQLKAIGTPAVHKQFHSRGARYESMPLIKHWIIKQTQPDKRRSREKLAIICGNWGP
jgi:hypothetical protein